MMTSKVPFICDKRNRMPYLHESSIRLRRSVPPTSEISSFRTKCFLVRIQFSCFIVFQWMRHLSHPWSKVAMRFVPFLPCDAMLARYAMLSSCVCPSVCPSVTRRYLTKTAKLRITQITPYDNPWTLFSDAKDLGKIPTRSPPTGALKRGVVSYNRRFSTSYLASRYISETVQDRDIVTTER